MKLSLNGKKLKNRDVNITIGVLDEKQKFLPSKMKVFNLKAKDSKVETPLFKIPFDWYHNTKEYYDFSTYSAKIKD